MPQGRCSRRGRRGEGDATASRHREARRRADVALSSCHLEIGTGGSAARGKSSTREGEDAQRRGRSCCFERDGVGKPERGQLRHVLPHCTWGGRTRESREGETAMRAQTRLKAEGTGGLQWCSGVVGRREKGEGRGCSEGNGGLQYPGFLSGGGARMLSILGALEVCPQFPEHTP